MEAVAQRLGLPGTHVPGRQRYFTRSTLAAGPILGHSGRMGWKEQPNGDHKLTTKNDKVYILRRLGHGSYELVDHYDAIVGTFSLGEGKRVAELRAHDNGDPV